MSYTYTNAHYEELNNIVRTGSKWCFCAGAFNMVPYGKMYVHFDRDTFEIKDILKASGARWDREDRAWKIAVTDAAMADRIIRRAAYADRKATEAGREDAAKAWAKAWCEWTPAPKTYKISLAKLAQAAAARLAATAEAKAEAAKAAKAAAPACKISLRPVVAAAIKGAAHAVRSARARKAWETRRRNAARAAEILSATCEPLVVDAEALPASVSYSATPGSECCYGRPAHGTCGRVVDTPRAADHLDGYPMVCGGKDDVQILVDHTLRRVDTSRCPRVVPCDPRDTRAVMFDSLCRTPAEGRRERRNARRRELYRLRKAA